MIDRAQHLSWEMVNDYADARLDASARREAAAHLDACERCRDVLAELRCLLAAASDVPEVIAPPEPLWSEIQHTIVARRGERVAREVTPIANPTRWTARWVAAAAIVLVFVSSGVTALVMRGHAGVATNADATGAVAAASRNLSQRSSPESALPASFVNAEAAYLSNVEALQRTFDRERSTLSPRTIAVVERSLATIDAAIREAREALLADPSNSELVRLLDSNYRKKVELLRRAADLWQPT